MATSIDITPLAGHAVVPTQLGIGSTPGYDAIDLRRLVQVGRREGVHIDTGWSVSEHTPNNLSVDVHPNASLATVEGDSVTGQGNYTVAPHNVDANLTFTTPHLSWPRVDQILLRVYDDAHDGLGLNKATLEVLAGTPTSGATLDNRLGAAPLPNTAMILADVYVPAGAITLTNLRIRDRRDSAITDEQPGDIIFSAASTRIGCLAAIGGAWNRVTYAKLFAKIGTSHGAGDGVLTFNVPDMQRRSPMGSGSGMTNGQHYGEESHVLSVAELAIHTHGNNTDNTDTNHVHSGTTDSHAAATSRLVGSLDSSHAWSLAQTVAAGANVLVPYAPGGYVDLGTGDHTHPFTTGWADRAAIHSHPIRPDGSSSGHNTIHPVTVGNYFIKF